MFAPDEDGAVQWLDWEPDVGFIGGTIDGLDHRDPLAPVANGFYDRCIRHESEADEAEWLCIGCALCDNGAHGQVVGMHLSLTSPLDLEGIYTSPVPITSVQLIREEAA